MSKKDRTAVPERDAWRQYACAALARVTAAEIHGNGYGPDTWTDLAVETADLMIKAERARFCSDESALPQSDEGKESQP